MAVVKMGSVELCAESLAVVLSGGRLCVTADGVEHRADSVVVRAAAPDVVAGQLYEIAVEQVTVVNDGDGDDTDEERCELGLALTSGADKIDVAWVYSIDDLQSVGVRHPAPVLSSHTDAVCRDSFRAAAGGAALCADWMLDRETNKLCKVGWRTYADVAAFRCGGDPPAWVSPTAAQCNVDVLADPDGPPFADLPAMACAIRTASSRKRAR